MVPVQFFKKIFRMMANVPIEQPAYFSDLIILLEKNSENNAI